MGTKSIDEFYRNGEILLTGGTGFLGKLLIVKLLKSFTDINNIYLLVRDKKGSNPEQRIEEMFENVAFKKLNEDVPGFKSKIQVIPCNFKKPDLGLTLHHKQMLMENVNIVIHGAATVRFDEDIQIAIDTNVRATKDILNLAKQFRKLMMFTYISTAFSQSKLSKVEERIYEPKTSYCHLLELSDLSAEHPELKKMKSRLAEEGVNTYTLTKAAAEHLISEEAKKCPISIFRPSIVISTAKEPIPGYIDNLYGPTGIVTGVQAGVIRSVFCCPDVRADMIPADLAVNALICTTWDAYNKFQTDNTSLRIYNFGSKDNPITWSEFTNKAFQAVVRYPYSKMFSNPFIYISQIRLLHTMRCLLLHYLVGYGFDFYFWMMGQKSPSLVSVYRKIDKVIALLEPFTMKDWEFDNQNTLEAWSLLSSSEKQRFPFNIEDLVWDDYLDQYVQGLLVHHLQDSMDPETRKIARKRAERFQMIHQMFKIILYLLSFFTLWSFVRHMVSP